MQNLYEAALDQGRVHRDQREVPATHFHLTDDEFQLLHESEQGASVADVSIDTTDLSPEGCATQILRLWTVGW